MSDNNESQVIVLCEDRAHWHFIREFFMLRGWNPRKLQLVIAPMGRGAAEQWVRKRYAREIKACRSKMQYRNIMLVVMIDADRKTVAERKNQLNNSYEMRGAGQKQRTDEERIAIFVPKRNIETWFCFLDRENPDETNDYKTSYRNARPTHFAKILSDRCRQKYLPSGMLPSLEDACLEWQRLML